MNVSRFAFLVLCVALPLAAQKSTYSYERVLVPVFAHGGGALGSQWVSSLVVMSSFEQSVTLATPVFSGDPRCPSICGCGTTATLTQNEPDEVCPSFGDVSGMVLYIPRRSTSEDDGGLSFHLRVRDTSRADQNAGTEVPVVRERNMRDGDPFWLLGVDTDSHFRVGLRFFDVVPIDNLPVSVRVVDLRGDELLDTTIKLSYPIQTFAPDPFPLRPAFAMISDLTTQFPQLRDKGLVNIEVQFSSTLADPPYPHKHVWAMASITNNTTQLFTTVTPQ